MHRWPTLSQCGQFGYVFLAFFVDGSHAEDFSKMYFQCRTSRTCQEEKQRLVRRVAAALLQRTISISLHEPVGWDHASVNKRGHICGSRDRQCWKKPRHSDQTCISIRMICSNPPTFIELVRNLRAGASFSSSALSNQLVADQLLSFVVWQAAPASGRLGKACSRRQGCRTGSPKSAGEPEKKNSPSTGTYFGREGT